MQDYSYRSPSLQCQYSQIMPGMVHAVKNVASDTQSLMFKWWKQVLAKKLLI